MKNNSGNSEKQWYSAQDLMEMFGICRNNLKKMVKNGVIPKPLINSDRTQRWHVSQINSLAL